MIPHQPPMLFEYTKGKVTLTEPHPLSKNGGFRAIELVELAAQLAGASLEGAHRSGMLVEIESAEIRAPWVPAGTELIPEVIPVKQLGTLHRFRVRLPGVLDVALTLKVV